MRQLHRLVQTGAELGVKVILCLLGQTPGQLLLHTGGRDEIHLIKGALAHAGHGGFILFLFLRAQAGLQRGEEGFGALLLGQADDSAHMAHLGHVQHAQQRGSLLRSAAGIQNDQRALGKHPDAAAVVHGGNAIQNRFIGDVHPLAAERQCQLHRHGGIACGVTPQKGQRHRIAAVVYPACELLRLQKGDILRVGHYQLTATLARSHNQLTEHRLGLLRRGDADAFLAHHAACQCSQTFHRAAHAVRSHRCDGAHRHFWQHRSQTCVRQLYYRQRAAGFAKAVRSGNKLCRLQRQLLMGSKGIGGAAQQCFVHRLAIHTDAGSKGLAPGMVDTSTDPLCLQDGRQQTRHRRFTGSACHTHELHLLHRGGQQRTQLRRVGKAVRQSCKILICLLDGHSYLLFM